MNRKLLELIAILLELQYLFEKFNQKFTIKMTFKASILKWLQENSHLKIVLNKILRSP